MGNYIRAFSIERAEKCIFDMNEALVSDLK